MYYIQINFFTERLAERFVSKIEKFTDNVVIEDWTGSGIEPPVVVFIDTRHPWLIRVLRWVIDPIHSKFISQQ